MNTSKKTGKALGFNNIFGGVGIGIGALSAGIIIDYFNWQSAFIIPGIISLLIGSMLGWHIFTKQISLNNIISEKFSDNPEKGQYLKIVIIMLISITCMGFVFQILQTSLPKVIDIRLSESLNLNTTTIGLSVAMYMAYASFFVLQTVCVLCLIVYASVIGIFLLSGNIEAAQMRHLPLGVVADVGLLVRRPLGLGVVSLFLFSSIWSIFWFSNQETPSPVVASVEGGRTQVVPPVVSSDQQSEFERYWESQPRVSIDLGQDANDAVLVTVVKFNDYQCPACANAHRIYRPVFEKYESRAFK